MNRIEKQKKTEHLYITKYMEKFHNITPKYIIPKIDIPDGYFIASDEKYWAVEAVSYFMDQEEKNSITLKNILKKYNKQKDNIFRLCFEHIGKKKVPTVIIRYGEKNKLISDLIEGEQYILSILCNCKYWNKEFKNFLYNNENCTLEKFLNDTLEEGSILNITLDKKFKYNVNLKLHYSKVFDKREISNCYIWWNNKDEYIKSICNAIKSKIDKYENYELKMKTANQKFDRYCLVVYPQKIPIEVDEQEIYKAIRDTIKNIKYDEIAIQIWKKIILIKNE